MVNQGLIRQIVQVLLKVFCGGDQKQHNQHQQQQGQGGFGGQYPGQQQQQQQQQQYPPQQAPYHGGQQQGGSWAQAAGGQPGGQHKPNKHSNQQQQHGGQQPFFGNQQQQHRPQGLPAGGILGPYHPGKQDDNQINQANEHYMQLRAQARHEGDESHRCFAASQQAYQSGNGAKAHDLSAEGKQHAARQDQLDDEASSWIFIENNRDSPPGTLDLHGLYVKEAIERTESAIREAQGRGDTEMQIIVGKGLHSQGHVAKIKPAVEDLMRRYNLAAHIDSHNTGVLVVDLRGGTQGGRSRDAGGLVDQMQKDEGEGCIIM
ncbi:uncharacterized protein MKK02DRAFT_45710 [Dioszegia hungarica]|uniref:Smr domain-containing protein n=1 Tax=Dioszegia hungarica TaxID=4972 RepID=A0AA38HA77_9TREE|nr:uncharacterized protein MKK02DRAFT_45710 [Dioszegia hungarica]KAI9637000.1 hypothetical protein MKK02DRAFT_45710 [Dioszegia hungarica]